MTTALLSLSKDHAPSGEHAIHPPDVAVAREVHIHPHRQVHELSTAGRGGRRRFHRQRSGYPQAMASRLSLHEFKIVLLRCFAERRDHQHRTNVLGRENHPGALEEQLGMGFTVEERVLASRGLQQLEKDGLVQATHRNTTAPADWLEITTAGRRALERGALDDLDRALTDLDSALLTVRHGAWAALDSSQPDALRQAAHSGRELIRQVLDRLAPDAEVKKASWFQTGVVRRRDRVRLAMEKCQGRASQSTARIIEAQCNLMDATYDRLSALAHADGPLIREHVEELLRAAEAALKDLLRGAPSE